MRARLRPPERLAVRTAEAARKEETMKKRVATWVTAVAIASATGLVGSVRAEEPGRVHELREDDLTSEKLIEVLKPKGPKLNTRGIGAVTDKPNCAFYKKQHTTRGIAPVDAKAPAPVAIANHDCSRRTRLVFGFGEATTQSRCHPPHVDEARRDNRAPQRFGQICGRLGDILGVEARDPLEGRIQFVPVLQANGRYRRFRRRRILLKNPNEAVAVGKR